MTGISPVTGLPRFVMRISKGDRFYYYFRRRGDREPLPAPTDPAFGPMYVSKLVAHGLLSEANTPAFPKPITPEKVYFIEDTGTGAIKIGVSRRPGKRLTSLQIGSTSKLRLLATTIGGKALEAELHVRFAAHHRRGEWFERHPDILAEIEKLAA